MLARFVAARRAVVRSLVVAAVAALSSSCASARAVPDLTGFGRPAWGVAAPPDAPAPVALERDVFARDHAGSISEADLHAVLDAPVALAPGSRVGVVPVADRYDPSGDTPVVAAPGALARTLEETGLFDMVSEVSTDFPATASVSGLRELAARYRADYLLLYRHRFVERARPTPFIVSSTFETEAVLEATLFDVRTGTILFTVHARGEAATVDVSAERAQRGLREALIEEASRALGDDVVVKVRRLAEPALAAR